jgi:hypothetical protein
MIPEYAITDSSEGQTRYILERGRLIPGLISPIFTTSVKQGLMLNLKNVLTEKEA